MTANVYRFDNNPANTYTYLSWVFIAAFNTAAEAVAYVDRAQTPTARYQVRVNWTGECDSRTSYQKEAI